MFKSLKTVLLILFSASMLLACGDSDAPSEKSTTSVTEATAVKADVSDMAVAEVAEEELTETVYLPSQVIYQEEIYKNWPYAQAPAEAKIISEEVAAPTANANPQMHTINAEARIFRPDTIYINPGDSVGWTNMTSHNSVSVEGLIPDGATSWAGKLGQNLKITLDVEGIYAYVCQPHIGFGMVGIIVVGKPSNLEEVKTFAKDTLKGPFRRLIGKLNKVKIP